jgi:hypothetical protein
MLAIREAAHPLRLEGRPSGRWRAGAMPTARKAGRTGRRTDRGVTDGARLGAGAQLGRPARYPNERIRNPDVLDPGGGRVLGPRPGRRVGGKPMLGCTSVEGGDAGLAAVQDRGFGCSAGSVQPRARRGGTAAVVVVSIRSEEVI